MGFAYPLIGTDTPSVPELIRTVGRQWNACQVPEAIATYRQILELVPTLVECRDNLIMALDLDPDATSAECLAARRAWWREEGVARYVRRQPLTNDRDPNRPLKIGYVSPDWRRRSSAIRNILPMIGSHSAAVQPYCYSTRCWNYDAEDRPARMVSIVWRDVEDLDEAQLADQIRADGIDILVELAGYTAYHNLHTLCRKPAPVIVTGFGYCTGLGLDAVDALLSDAIVHRREACVERIVQLPSMLTYALSANAPPVNALPCLTRPPTFAAFHKPQKVNVSVLRLWRRILDAVPGSRVVFKHFWYTADVRAWIRQYLGEAAEFLETTAHTAHLAAYHETDLTLDPYPQTGGMTTCDSLAMGNPVVTLIGDRAVQRTSASFLTNVGMPEFIATTEDEYVATAVWWVTKGREGLNLLRGGLRGRLLASPICANYVGPVEAAYRMLWRDWCAA